MPGMLAEEYLYTSLENIKTYWGYPTFFRDDGRLTLLGESIVDSFIVASLSWEIYPYYPTLRGVKVS